jgi:hypothetical protein
MSIDNKKIFTKSITFHVVVEAEDRDDATYWIKKELAKEAATFEDIDPKEVGSVEDLPKGYSLDDLPDNGNEDTIRDIIQPGGLEAMRRAIKEGGA